MRKSVLSATLAAAMLVSMTGCSASSSSEETKAPAGTAETSVLAESTTAAGSDLDYIKEKGKLVVGITDFEPMDYKNEAGEWIGFDADVAKSFADSLGVKVEFIEIDWDNKIMELNSKTIDCVWNGMTLTDEVKASMNCSNAYCINSQVVVVKAADADKYQTVESLKDLTFAVESGSAGKDMAEENKLNYTEVQNQAAALMEVAAGTSDAAIIDSLMAGAMVGEGTGYEQLTYTVSLNSEEYGVGFRKDSDLTEKLNQYIKDSYADGSIKTVAEKYGVQEALIKQ